MGSLQKTTTEQLGDVINRLEEPIFLVDEQRLILFHNAAAKRVLKAKTGVGSRQGRLIFSTPADDARFEYMTSECRSSPRAKSEMCRALKSPRRTAPKDWLVMISVLPGASGASSGCLTFVVHLVSRLHPRKLPVAALHDLFGLTRKETDVLARLIRSESLRDVASHMTLSHETIRAHLKRIFRKCDVRSRTELFALLQKISMFSHWVE